MNKPAFSALGLSEDVIKAVAALGYEEASPIQAATIPILLEGRDLVGQSQTGSGKTAAFAIPAIEKVDPHLGDAQTQEGPSHGKDRRAAQTQLQIRAHGAR